MIQGHLGRFGFSGDEVQRRADTLSGGERARVALAMMMLSHANLLMLDEPTNHLDVESIEALEDAIEAYDGTVILVSHDRELLRASDDADLGTCTTAHHRLRRQLRRVGGGRRRARADAAVAAQKAAPTPRRAAERPSPRRAGQDAPSRRAARRAIEEAEASVAALEDRVAELAAQLEDPALYADRTRGKAAATIDGELKGARRELEAAIKRWEAAMQLADERA